MFATVVVNVVFGALVDLIIRNLVKKFQQDQDLGALKDDEAFEAFAAYCVLSELYEGEFYPDRFRTGGGNDFGIDVAAIILNGDLMIDAAEVRDAIERARYVDARFVLIQAKTTAGFESKVFSDLTDNLRQLFNDAPITYPASTDVTNLRSCVEAIYHDVGKLSHGLPQLYIRYAATGDPHNELLVEKGRSSAAELRKLGWFDEVDVRAIGADDLWSMYRRGSQTVAASFTMPRHIALPDIPGVNQAFVGVLPARTLVSDLLADVTGGIRKTLFYEDVRDFQDYNTVNQAMRNTLQSEDQRDRFAVLNNGITIVARQLTRRSEHFEIRDFQIVNGCQTCHVIFNERDSLTDGIHVNVRIIESQDENVINGIVAATNSQTAVTEDDLVARETFHKKLEEFFRAHEPPKQLYYERRSRQYASDMQLEKTRIVTREQLTRAYAAMFLGEPARAARFTELKRSLNQNIFESTEHPWGHYTAAYTLYRVEWLFRNRKFRREFAQARFHLLAAIKQHFLGPASLPKTTRAAEKACKQILDCMWDAAESAALVGKLVIAIELVLADEEPPGVPLSQIVRTQRFAERFRNRVSSIRSD